MTKVLIEIPEDVLADISEIIESKGGRVLINPLNSNLNEQNNSLWNSLNDEQKQEVLLAYEESEKEENLVDAKTVFGNLK